MLNKVFLHGRLTKIPELRRTNTGKSVCSFTLAVDRDSGSQAADYITCVAWEKRAEFVSNYFTKGQEALVAGSLNMRDYEDKSGVRRTVAEVIVSQVDFCGPKNAARDRDGNVRRPTAEEQQTFRDIADDGDLPF